MSNDQQPNEQKGPTIWHVLIIGGLIGVPFSYIFNLIINFVLNYFDWWNFIYPVLLVIIGAGVGASVPLSAGYKWFGLLIGAVLGTVASYYLFFSTYF
jgi:hypothetical protein